MTQTKPTAMLNCIFPMILETRPDLEADLFLALSGFIATGKEADAFLRITGQELPFLVLEAGWSDPGRDLIEDARLWLWGTQSVNFVGKHAW